ncbi:MAG TPA: adenylosuccinate lyase [Maritimibacter sp.]|nr:adenylosuccinate lyase [Maritimibacter sp.]
MTVKTLLAAAAVACAPTLALACPMHETASMSCKDGFKWDEKSSACVEQVTG